jgi:hypothetical protein
VRSLSGFHLDAFPSVVALPPAPRLLGLFEQIASRILDRQPGPDDARMLIASLF